MKKVWIAVIIVAAANAVGWFVYWKMGQRVEMKEREANLARIFLKQKLLELDSKSGSLESPLQITELDRPLEIFYEDPVSRFTIYTKLVKEINNGKRTWPVIQIFKKIGDSPIDMMAEVGKIGEFPEAMTMGPDKNYLLINLESRLKILDLTTHKLNDLLIPERRISGVSFSPDRSKIFIWDQKYVGAGEYFVHILDILDRKDKIIKRGNDEGAFLNPTWRADDKVVLGKAMGEYSPVYFFDLSSKELKRSPFDNSFGTISADGKVMAVVEEWTNDICNEFSGSASGVYHIIDPVSGNFISKFGDTIHDIEVIDFSPDNSEVLYSFKVPWQDRSDCEKKQDIEYYKINLHSKVIIKVEDPTIIQTEWKKTNTNYNSIWRRIIL